MKYVKSLILFICIIQFNVLYAQEELDVKLKEYESASLEKKMELFFYFFQKFDSDQQDSVLFYVKDLQSEGIEKKNESAIALANYGLTPYLLNNSLFEEAEEKLEKAKKYYLKVQNDTMLADVYNAFGNASYLQGNIPQAEWYYNESSKYANASGERRFQLLSTLNLARIYMGQEKYDEAKKMIQEYASFMLADGNMRKLAGAHGLMGQLYLNQEKHEKAIEFFTKSMESGLAAGSMKVVANGYTNLAIAEYFSGEKEKSEQYFQLALAYRLKDGDKYYVAEGYFNLGDFYFGTSNIDSAIVNYSNSLKVAESSDNSQGQKDALMQMNLIYDTLNQYQNQINVLQKLIKVQEKIAKKQSYNEIKALKSSFKQTHRETINTGGIREDHLQGKVANYQSIFNHWVWVVFICIVGLALFIFAFRRFSKK